MGGQLGDRLRNGQTIESVLIVSLSENVDALVGINLGARLEEGKSYIDAFDADHCAVEEVVITCIEDCVPVDRRIMFLASPKERKQPYKEIILSL